MLQMLNNLTLQKQLTFHDTSPAKIFNGIMWEVCHFINESSKAEILKAVQHLTWQSLPITKCQFLNLLPTECSDGLGGEEQNSDLAT